MGRKSTNQTKSSVVMVKSRESMFRRTGLTVFDDGLHRPSKKSRGGQRSRPLNTVQIQQTLGRYIVLPVR